MKKIFLTLAMVVLAAGIAKAEDKGTEFKFGGEMLNRWYWDMNPFAVSSNGASENNWLMRNQFHINAISSDKMQAYIDLLHTSIWGGGQAVPITSGAYATPPPTGGPNGGASAAVSALQVQEAWMWWKVTDSFSVRVGRQSAEFGSGMIIAKNDWLANPYAFDAAMGRFTWDFLDLDVGGGKLYDGGVANATTSTTDNEIVMYGLNAGFKNLPDFLKKADVFAVQINSDVAGGGAFVPSAGTTPNGVVGTNPNGAWNVLTYGVHLKGDVANFDYHADAAFQSGKQKAGTNAPTAVDANFKGTMYDLEAGYTFPEFMKGRVSVGYHQDSGADGSTDYAQYQPLFYDVHNNGGGMMDIFGWGNLTDLKVGLTLNPADDTSVGAKYHILSRTTSNGGYTTGTGSIGNQATYLNFFPGVANNAGSSTDKSLGSEIDVWASHDYGHGFQLMAEAGFVTLGNYFKPAGGTAPGNPWQVLFQGKYNF